MWSREIRLLLRLAAVMALAGAVGGCFQPLYGERAPNGGPAIRDMLAAVDIEPIAVPNGGPLSRIAVQVQNELRFGLTGGAGSAAPTHRLVIKMSSGISSIIIDRDTGRAEFNNFNLDATYTLTEIVSNKPVATGSAVTRVTYDIPGQEQRFSQFAGQRDAEGRAAKLLAEQIKSRLASYFVAGT
jgi:LPS-assembly lipoprotein